MFGAIIMALLFAGVAFGIRWIYLKASGKQGSKTTRIVLWSITGGFVLLSLLAVTVNEYNKATGGGRYAESSETVTPPTETEVFEEAVVEEPVVEEEPAKDDTLGQAFADKGFEPMYENLDTNDVWIKWGKWDANGFTTSVVVRLGFTSDRCETWRLEGNFYNEGGVIVSTGFALGSNAQPGDEFKEELIDFTGEATRVELTEFDCYGF